MAMTDTGPGLQSQVQVNAAPVIPRSNFTSKPHYWTYIWFAVAVLVILGFHIRIFGRPVPPAARFP